MVTTDKPSSDEIRAAMEWADTEGYIGIEDSPAQTEVHMDTLAACVRELYEALQVASAGRDERKLVAKDWDNIDDTLDRYRAALEGGDDGL
jgi:hypothetical protein